METLKTVCDNYSEKLTEEDYHRAMIGAATAGHQDIVSFIWERLNPYGQIEPLHQDAGGLALAMAAGQGHIEVFEYLVTHGAPIERAGQLLRRLYLRREYTPDRSEMYRRMFNALAIHQIHLIGAERMVPRENLTTLADLPPEISLPILQDAFKENLHREAELVDKKNFFKKCIIS